jgi:quercetin dioxygenase-like cupin family protein/DNA-binding XRE family transcriptional regulator
METQEMTDAERLGRSIRLARRGRGMTLVELAALAGLSHPFISQVERGVARPSMLSLERISRALGTSQLELYIGAAEIDPSDETSAPTVVRAGEGDAGDFGGGKAVSLTRGRRGFHPMTFEGDNRDPGDFHSHPEDEFVHVTEGTCIVDLGEQGRFTLATGDSLYYAGGTPHRWLSADGATYRLFVVKQHLAALATELLWTANEPEAVVAEVLS